VIRVRIMALLNIVLIDWLIDWLIGLIDPFIDRSVHNWPTDWLGKSNKIIQLNRPVESWRPSAELLRTRLNQIESDNSFEEMTIDDEDD